MKKDIEFYKKRLEVLAKDNINLITENVSLNLENKELKEKISLYGVGCSVLNKLIEKHRANKKLALINCDKMKHSKDFPWYDATFNNELLFVFDLEDLKIRLGL